MYKKLFSIILTVLIVNISLLPAFAKKKEVDDFNFVINARYAENLDLNKTEEGSTIQFVATKDTQNAMGLVIPKGTIFNGQIMTLEKSNFAYRRAKAKVIIDEMVFPSGHKYQISGEPKTKVLKSSFVANTLKGAALAPMAVVVGSADVVAVTAEAISIIGVLAIDKTNDFFCKALHPLTNGVNYTKKKFDKINLKIDLIPGYDYTPLVNNEGETDYANYIIPANNVTTETQVEENDDTRLKLNPLIEQVLIESN